MSRDHYRPDFWEDPERPAKQEVPPNIVCDDCGREFMTPRDLAQHRAKEHPDE